MITLEEIKNLPDPIKNQILDYAENLVEKYKARQKTQKTKTWVDVSARGRSIGESASETIVKLREEEKW